jgi:tRNA-intron endonuclease, archaea type
MIQAYLSSEKITSTSSTAFSLYEKSRFGEKKAGKILFSPTETLYLLEKSRLSLFSNKKLISKEDLLKKLRRKDKKIETKYLVFKDLRKKGYIVKTALKFGAEFRVYSKGIKPGQDHAKWVVFTVKESETHSWHEFTAKNRVAHSTKKKLLLAIVDEESDISYYEVSWLKP